MIEPLETLYGEKVSFRLHIEAKEVAEFMRNITNITNGTLDWNDTPGVYFLKKTNNMN
ncbi:MAG: DUF1949 domain-containing protein [Clostridium sp.]|jgi:hypothetical protein|nr:DUF1949 domain-containing protein [Clostridium sp.]